MTGLAEELPVATETGQLRSHPSGFRPERTLAYRSDSGCSLTHSCRLAWPRLKQQRFLALYVLIIMGTVKPCLINSEEHLVGRELLVHSSPQHMAVLEGLGATRHHFGL